MSLWPHLIYLPTVLERGAGLPLPRGEVLSPARSPPLTFCFPFPFLLPDGFAVVGVLDFLLGTEESFSDVNGIVLGDDDE